MILEEMQKATRHIIDKFCNELGMDGIEELETEEVHNELHERRYKLLMELSEDSNNGIFIAIINMEDEGLMKLGNMRVESGDDDDEVKIIGTSISPEMMESMRKSWGEI